MMMLHLAQKVQPFQIVPEEKIDLPENIQKLYNCSKIPTNVFSAEFAGKKLEGVFENLRHS